jgi:hypothetical protein
MVAVAGIAIFSTLHAQTTQEHRVAFRSKSVVLRDLHLINDPHFIPNTIEDANEKEETESHEKKIKDERADKVFEPAIISPVQQDPSQRFMINESPCVSYMSMRYGNFIPPDVAGAVGNDHLILTENDSFRVINKNGIKLFQQLHQDGAGLWAGMYTNNLFDPKIIYDPFMHRWIHVILADSNLGSSSILIAVSSTPDPMGSWIVWAFDTDAENDQWFDYPSVGFNNKWLVVNGMMFSVPGNSVDNVSRTFVFDIDELYYSNTVDYTIFSTTGYSHIVPALTYDPNMNNLWCVTNDDVDDNDLRFFLISGPTNAPSFTEEGYISIGSDWGMGGGELAPQSGTSTLINAGDHRIESVFWRNGILFSSQTVFLPDGNSPTTCTIQYVACDPATETVHEAIRFASDATSMYAFPCLAVNAHQDIIISCARFTNSAFPSACVLVRRTGNNSWFENIFKSGEDWYVNFDSQTPPRNRWGDYTSVSIDPMDDQSAWVISEYSRPKSATNTGRWGTWCAKICSGICDPVVTVNTEQSSSVTKKFEASDVIYANSLVQPNAYIKLDGGNKVVLQNGFKASYGSTLKAFIEGCLGPQ